MAPLPDQTFSLIPATLRLAATTTLPALTISFKIKRTVAASPLPPIVEITDASIISGVNNVAFKGWRNNWAATAVSGVSAKADAYSGNYTFGISLPGNQSTNPLIGNPLVPQGSGYGSFVVATAGTFTLVGRTPDGESLTGAQWIGPNGEFFIFQPLYTTATKGSILGELRIEANTPSADNDIFGDLTHVRPPNGAALTSARAYRSGFGTTQMVTTVPPIPAVVPTTVTTPVALIAVGGRYIPPVAATPSNPNPTVFLGIPAALSSSARNAELIFSEDGLLPSRTSVFPVPYNQDIVASRNPNIPITIAARSVVTVPTATSSPANPALTTLTPVPATGLFSGKFTLSDSIARPPLAPLVIPRSVSYQGLVVRERVSAKGEVPRIVQTYGTGYFLVNQLPPTATASAASTPSISGSVSLEKGL